MFNHPLRTLLGLVAIGSFACSESPKLDINLDSQSSQRGEKNLQQSDEIAAPSSSTPSSSQALPGIETTSSAATNAAQSATALPTQLPASNGRKPEDFLGTSLPADAEDDIGEDSNDKASQNAPNDKDRPKGKKVRIDRVADEPVSVGGTFLSCVENDCMLLNVDRGGRQRFTVRPPDILVDAENTTPVKLQLTPEKPLLDSTGFVPPTANYFILLLSVPSQQKVAQVLLPDANYGVLRFFNNGNIGNPRPKAKGKAGADRCGELDTATEVKEPVSLVYKRDVKLPIDIHFDLLITIDVTCDALVAKTAKVYFETGAKRSPSYYISKVKKKGLITLPVFANIEPADNLKLVIESVNGRPFSFREIKIAYTDVKQRLESTKIIKNKAHKK